MPKTDVVAPAACPNGLEEAVVEGAPKADLAGWAPNGLEEAIAEGAPKVGLAGWAPNGLEEPMEEGAPKADLGGCPKGVLLTEGVG